MSGETEGDRERLNDLAQRLDRAEGKSSGLGAAGNIIVAVILAAAAIVGIIIGTR